MHGVFFQFLNLLNKMIVILGTTKTDQYPKKVKHNVGET